MDKILLTGADAWFGLLLWSLIMVWIGWSRADARADRYKAMYDTQLHTLAIFMSKFPITRLEVTEVKDDEPA